MLEFEIVDINSYLQLSFCVFCRSLQAFVALNEFQKAREDLEKVSKLLLTYLVSPLHFAYNFTLDKPVHVYLFICLFISGLDTRPF